ncbi:MAG: hypothetical protein ACJZ1R_07540 [Candidatus Neomarinimicrobiota bacterium]
MDETWLVNDFGIGLKSPIFKTFTADLRLTKFDPVDISNPFVSSADLEINKKIWLKYFYLSIGPKVKMISFEKNTVFSTGIAMSISFMDDKRNKEKAKKQKKSKNKSKNKGSKKGNKGGVSRPGATGSSEIDNFVTSTFDLNDKIVDLEEKLESVSNGLSKSNAVLTDIGNSASGPVGWAMMELQKGIAKSKNSIIASARSLQSNVPDLPEIYFDLIKESLIAPETISELAKGTQPEEALLLTFNKKADEKGIPTTSKDWIMGLNLDLDPTKTLRTKLGTIKDGVVGGKDKLTSVPDDLKDIGSQAQALLSSATELPKAAKSLGLKAPKALKAIKATTDVLKNVPNEVKSIGDETKKVIEEVDQVLKNIQNILSTS